LLLLAVDIPVLGTYIADMEKAKDIIVKQVEPALLAKLELLRAKRGYRSRAELIRNLLEEAAKAAAP